MALFRFFSNNFQSEVNSDVMSGVAVDEVVLDVRAKHGDPRLEFFSHVTSPLRDGAYGIRRKRTSNQYFTYGRTNNNM